MHNQKKDNNNNKNPELPENRTVWKSDSKKLKKKHSFRQVGREEMAARAERTCSMEAAGGPDGQGSSWWTGWSHICVRINQEEQLESETDIPHDPGL